jgi:SAM-dependent methyltransferase
MAEPGARRPRASLLGDAAPTALGRLVVRPSELSKTVRQYYGDPRVVAAYSAMAADGLIPFEAALIRRAFRPGQHVLDVGCGGGREAVEMVGLGLQVVGIDLIPEMVRTASRYAASQQVRIPVLAADATVLPFQAETFDGVAMLGQVITFLPARDLRIAALRSAWRVLRPGGSLVMTTHNRGCHWKFRLYFAWANRWRALIRRLGLGRGLGDYDRWSRRDTAGAPPFDRRLYFHMYDLDEALADLRLAGFDVVEAKGRRAFESDHDDPQHRDYLLGFVARRLVGGS